ncbi:MAG: winged helix-turn-helix transcriptional regulator [Ornithinibacter sp.]
MVRIPSPQAVEPADASPAALAWSAENCSIGRTLDVLRDRWSFLVLREVFNGVRRFDDMRVRTHIPRAVLSDRLATLVDQDLLRRVPYQEPGRRTRHEYRLTRKGLDLYPVLAAMLEWGDRYLADPDGPALELVHRDCGAAVHLVVRCDAGHVVPDPRDILTHPGPAARPRTA